MGNRESVNGISDEQTRQGDMDGVVDENEPMEDYHEQNSGGDPEVLCINKNITDEAAEALSDRMSTPQKSHNSALHYIDDDYGQCSFSVILSSTHKNETVEKTLCISGYPTTGRALKNQIESKFNIPVCVQMLLFDSQVIKDDTLLKSHYLQHGDTVQVQYTMNADIEYFSDLIGTLVRIEELLNEVVADLVSGAPITYVMHQKLQTDCGAFTSDCVPLRYFSVFPTGTPNANQLYFLHLGGLDILIKIYRLLHELPWHKLPHELQGLEYACLQIIWNFSATLGIRQMIVNKGVMDLVFKTMNRTKIVPNKHLELQEPLLDQFVSPQHSVSTLAEAVYASVVVTGNFAEMPQCRLPIASSVEVIDALLAAMLSPTYTYTCARSGMCAMLCLSFSPATHKYINQEETLERVLEICERTHILSDGTTEKERSINQTLVGFYSLLFFCNLLAHWTIELPLQSQLTDFMTQFIESTSHDEILKRMQEKRYYWSTFIPFLSLCYCPSLHTAAADSLTPKHLLELTVKAGVLSMKCMCLSENALEVIEYEGLKDFITCMSWNSSLTGDVKALLQEVTQIAHRNLRFQPPSLCNIVKAMLASRYCGLDRVLECDTYSLVFYVVGKMSP